MQQIKEIIRQELPAILQEDAQMRRFVLDLSRQAVRLLVISPMVDQRAQAVADKLDIQVYSYAQNVDPTIFG